MFRLRVCVLSVEDVSIQRKERDTVVALFPFSWGARKITYGCISLADSIPPIYRLYTSYGFPCANWLCYVCWFQGTVLNVQHTAAIFFSTKDYMYPVQVLVIGYL